MATHIKFITLIVEGDLALIRARVIGIFHRSCIVHWHVFGTCIVHRGLSYAVHRIFAFACTVHNDLFTRTHAQRPP